MCDNNFHHRGPTGREVFKCPWVVFTNGGKQNRDINTGIGLANAVLREL